MLDQLSESEWNRVLDDRFRRQSPSSSRFNTASPSASPVPTAPKLGAFQARIPESTGDLWDTEKTASALGLRHDWQVLRLWATGRIGGIDTPSGARFFSDSITAYAGSGAPGLVPSYSTPDEFLHGSEAERSAGDHIERLLSDHVSKRPMGNDELRAWCEKRGLSGYRHIGLNDQLLTACRAPAGATMLSGFPVPALSGDQPAPAGSVAETALGARLRRELYYAFQDRPHHFPGGLFPGLFGRGPQHFNCRVSEGLDKVGQAKYGFRSSRYSLELETGWNDVERKPAVRTIDVNTSEYVPGSALLSACDRRSIVLASL